MAKVQRLRVTFTRGDELKYITHLDMMRFWERALRRAGLPVAYSEGFTPHPQISLATPLAVGTTSEAELMDVYLSEHVAPKRFLSEASKQLPSGVSVVAAEEVGMSLPAVQADVRFADYDVDIAGVAEDVARAKAEGFLAKPSVPWEHKREKETRSYDIRALVETIDVAPRDDGVRLHMRLRSDNSGAGRPEQVAAAVGLSAPSRIHRTKLVLAQRSPAHEAWRKRGRFAG